MSTGIDAIIQKILDDANAKGDRLVSGAQSEAEKMIAEAETRAAQKTAQIEMQSETECRNAKERIILDFQTEKKKKTLEARQNAVSACYEAVLAKLADLDEARYTELILKHISNSAKNGDCVEIFLTPKDGERLFGRLKQACIQSGITIQLSHELYKISGGVVIKNGKHLYNYSFEALIENDKRLYESEMIKELFT